MENISDMYTEKVQNGIAFLDEQFPDWHDRVTVYNVDVTSASGCPFARASGKGYTEACKNFGVDDSWAYEHGFNIPPYLLDTPEDDEIANTHEVALQEGWVQALTKIENE